MPDTYYWRSMILSADRLRTFDIHGSVLAPSTRNVGGVSEIPDDDTTGDHETDILDESPTRCHQVQVLPALIATDEWQRCIVSLGDGTPFVNVYVYHRSHQAAMDRQRVGWIVSALIQHCTDSDRDIAKNSVPSCIYGLSQATMAHVPLERTTLSGNQMQLADEPSSKTS